MRNRSIFSLKSIEDKKDKEKLGKDGSDKEFILEGKPMGEQAIIDKKTDKPEDNYTLNLNFTTDILSKNNNIISALEKVNSYASRPPIPEQKLLDFIEKKDYGLYYIIKKWKSSMTPRDNNLIKDIIKLYSNYNGYSKFIVSIF